MRKAAMQPLLYFSCNNFAMKFVIEQITIFTEISTHDDPGCRR